MRNMRCALTLAALSLAAPAAMAQTRPQNFVGVSVGTYLFLDGDTRDAFGSAPVTYGVALVQPFRQAAKGLRFDALSLSVNSDGNNLFLVGGTIGYEIQALPQGDRPTAFARIGVGPAYYSYDVNRRGLSDISGDRISFLGTAEVGYTFANRFVLSARYVATPELSGLNFSGVQFQLTYAAFKL